MHCPTGSNTLSTNANRLVDCRCAAGWQPMQDISRRNATHWCSLCLPGLYKATEGDDACILPCTVNALSLSGAVSPNDCYCIPGTYKVEETETCNRCVDAGILCPGNFTYTFIDASESGQERMHAMPESRAGYYLLGTARSQRCTLHIDNGSTCLGGSTFVPSSRCQLGPDC